MGSSAMEHLLEIFFNIKSPTPNSTLLHTETVWRYQNTPITMTDYGYVEMERCTDWDEEGMKIFCCTPFYTFFE